MNLGTEALRTLAFVVLVFGSQATIYAIRERRHLWGSRPSLLLAVSSVADIAIASTLAVGGIAMIRLAGLGGGRHACRGGGLRVRLGFGEGSGIRSSRDRPEPALSPVDLSEPPNDMNDKAEFYLHLSKEEQRKRFLERIDEPQKNWKFSLADIEERKFWNQYVKAYEECLSATSTRARAMVCRSSRRQRERSADCIPNCPRYVRRTQNDLPQIERKAQAGIAVDPQAAREVRS